MSAGQARVDAASRAVAEVLRSLGMNADRPHEILRSENNVVFGIDSKIIAKATEQGNADALRHEATVIGVLTNTTAPVVRSSKLGLGPFEANGWTVILLERISELSSQPSLAALTGSLADLHSVLASSPLVLPDWTTQIERTIEAWNNSPFDHPDQFTAQQAYSRFVQPTLAYGGPVQPIHGDAWNGQVISTPSGLRWIDFESACIGPREWDLAGFDDATGYGTFDERLWQQLKLVKSWSVAVWCNINQVHSPELASHVKHHLRRLAGALQID